LIEVWQFEVFAESVHEVDLVLAHSLAGNAAVPEVTTTVTSPSSSSMSAEVLKAVRSMGSFVGTAASQASGELTVKLVGKPQHNWWGLEHYPVMDHAAAAAAADGDKCVIVEAGSHAGAISLLASQLGCTVYAFEANKEHVKTFGLNMALNQERLKGKVHNNLRMIGAEPGHRIDEVVPAGTRVTVFKMDIDGPDAVAMQGAKGLFDAGVDYLSIEYNPKKQLGRSGGITGVQYLTYLHERGFAVYVLDCYFGDDKSMNAHGISAKCLRHNLQAGTSPPFVETSESNAFLSCLIQKKCTAKGKRLMQQQLIEVWQFEVFAESVHEVDLVLAHSLPS